MTVRPGARLGPYEVVAPIGAGGMGEVWRAKDTRLDRDVAIKVLPPGFADNEQMKLRFEREAKAISQLNHPHVCTLFDVGQATIEMRETKGGSEGASAAVVPASPLHYLVMELLEGESLADRIRRGPLPPHEVLRYGQQIALAMDAAHRQGITHRDLKPGNVMITKSGAKLLDFGLARTGTVSRGPVDGLTNLPTDAKPLTQEGTILGTFQYMAPEQLEGLEADARTDIFALGGVLYEMATGARPFQGPSKTSLIAAIVSSQPAPISSVIPMTPPALDHVVRKCLEKDPDHRWQSAHDVASELQWISEAGSAAGMPTPRVRRSPRLAWIGWLAAAAIAIAWIAVTVLHRPVAQPRIETSIDPPGGAMIVLTRGGIALSPQGRALAFVAHRPGETQRLWVRSLGSSACLPLAGTENASMPFWSPDGKRIGFIVGTKLFHVPVEGGSPELVVEGNLGGGGAWTPSGDIVYSNGAGIFRIPASGGTPTKVLEMPNHTLTSLEMLPDGKRFLFTSIRGRREPDAINLGSLDGMTPKRILAGVYTNTAFVSPGTILYLKDGNLRAQPVDPQSIEPRGESVAVAERVQYDPDVARGLFTASRDGALAYVAGTGAGETELAWVGRDGQDIETVAPPAMYYSPRLSHDGTRVVVDQSDRQTASGDIWILDLTRKAFTRLTWDPANSPIRSGRPMTA